MRLLQTMAILAFIFSSLSCASTTKAISIQQASIGQSEQLNLKKLDEAEAVEFAEKFIERNGYTDLPPDKKNISFESIEWESDLDELLKGRHNSLERKAFGVSKGRKGAKGWTVVFKYKNLAGKTGRAVTMNLDGSKAKVEHVDFILKMVDKEL